MKLKDLKNKEFEITEDGLLKVVEKNKTGKFVPKEYEKYWYVHSNGDVDFYRFANDKIDKYILNHQPVFRTEEEAEEYKHYLVVLSKYKHEFTYEEWKNTKIHKWYLVYDIERDAICHFSDTDSIGYSHSYFKTKEDAEYFIRKAGKENVKKFMFNIWE